MDIRKQIKILEERTTIKLSLKDNDREPFEDYNISKRRGYESICEVLKKINRRDQYIDEYIEYYKFFFFQFENLNDLKNKVFTPYFFGPKEEIPKLTKELYFAETQLGSLYTYGAKAIRMLYKIKKLEVEPEDNSWLQKFKKTRDLFIEHNLEIRNEKDLTDLFFKPAYRTVLNSDAEVHIDIVKEKTRNLQIGHINYELDYLETEGILFKYLKRL